MSLFNKFNIQKKFPRKGSDFISHKPFNSNEKIIEMDDEYKAIIPPRNEYDPYQVYKIRTKPIYAILLHPSLGSPAIVRPDQPLSLYYLIHQDMQKSYKYFHDDDDIKTEDNSIFLKRVLLQTGITPWKDLKEYPSKHKIISNISNHWMHEDDFAGRVDCSAPQPIRSYFELENAGFNVNNLRKPLFLKNKEGMIIAQIEPLILRHYSEKGYNYWIRLDIENHGLEKGLYNLTWNSLHPTESKDISNLMLPRKEKVCKIFYEPQDDILIEALEASGSEKKQAFNIPWSEACSETGTEDFDYALDASKIESLHPVYVTDEALLNTGHVTDIHISSQQHFFKKCSELQVIPGAEETDSPFIGKLCNVSFENIKSILDQMGQDPKIHVILITGDLVDFAKSLDPSKANIKSLGELWRGALSDEDNFEKGVDTLVMYSLIRYFYDRYQKPVFMVIGNHDAYGEPFGISPRVWDLKKRDGAAALRKAYQEDATPQE
ncbi:MAG: metallophosphoesterase, partial [Gammaproteobacteria bacterium]